MLHGAAARQRGYNNHSWDGFHYPGDNRTCWYTPFVIRNGRASLRPGFYALALFKHALGRRFCAVSTSTATGHLVRTWALTHPVTNRIYAYAINMGGGGKSGTVSITAPAGHTGTGFLNIMRPRQLPRQDHHHRRRHPARQRRLHPGPAQQSTPSPAPAGGNSPSPIMVG
jgi:hypothetical protein